MLEAEKRLTTNQLMRDEDEYFELDEIHVPLALVERKKPDKRGEEILPEQGAPLCQPEYEEKQRFEHEQFLQDILKNGKGKHNGKRIAIIGEPGAGKTTLLRKIAFWVEENTAYFPISISLADLPESNPKQEFLEQYLLEKWLKAALPYISPEMVEVTETLKTEFKKQCNQGRVWLLLDGVDEMPVQGKERLWAISNQLKGWVGQARVVLTCRLNVWEANRNMLADNFEIYRTLEFSYGDSATPDRVREFINKWFKRQPNLGQQLRQALDEPGKERIKDLVKNPLRLALLCSTWSLWREHGGLPDTKAKLYQGFVEKFYQWKSKEFPTTSSQQEQLNRALGELAKLAIDQTASRFRLKHSLVCEVLGKPDQSLFELALQLGWLNKVGFADESPDETDPVYAFWHPTFEEYFAAVAVDDWHFFLNYIPSVLRISHNPVQRIFKFLKLRHAPSYQPAPIIQGTYRIFESHWKEVILLWLGRNEDKLRQQKENFLTELISIEYDAGPFYCWRAFFLVVAGIAEFPEFSLFSEIVEKLVKLSCGQDSFQLCIEDYAREALKSIQIRRNTVIDALNNLTHTCQDERGRELAAMNLDEIRSAGSENIDIRIELPSINQDISLPEPQKLKEETNVDSINTEEINTQIERLMQSSPNNYESREIVKYLSKNAFGNEYAINFLTNLLQTGQLDNERRLITANALGKINPGNSVAIQTLIDLLQIRIDKENEETDNEDNNNDQTWIPKFASQILSEVGNDSSYLIKTLVNLLEDTTQEAIIHLYAAECLGKIDPGNQNAIDILNQRFYSLHLNKYADLLVAEALEKVSAYKKVDGIIALIIVVYCNEYIPLSRHAARHLHIYLWEVNNVFLKGIASQANLRSKLFPIMVSILKVFMNEQGNFGCDYNCLCYEFAWHCTQYMTYSEFYQAWNSQPCASYRSPNPPRCPGAEIRNRTGRGW